MLPYEVSQYGNPHSRTHAYGWESEAAVEKARKVRATCCEKHGPHTSLHIKYPRIRDTFFAQK